MNPSQLSLHFKNGGEARPGYLFLGAEPFYRDVCRTAIEEAVLGAEAGQGAKVEIDLREQPLSDLFEEARALSLFVSDRLVIGRNAEDCLLKPGAARDKLAKAQSDAYFASPTPGTTVLIEAVRFEHQDRDGRRKLNRIAKVFAAAPVRVDLKPLAAGEAKYVARILAQRLRLRIGPGVIAELVGMLGADGFRIRNELEKLALYVGRDRPVTKADLEVMVPEARQSGIYEFSDALAKRERGRALQLLDTMSKSGMYWPVQITLISGLFRQAYMVKELGLTDLRKVEAGLRALGVRIWPARARQLVGVASKFRLADLRGALIALHEADVGLRSARPDDRVVMEALVTKLTG